MIDHVELAAASIHAAISIVAAILAWWFVVIPAVVERFRQDIFAQRRSLFLFMADGNIASDHIAYQQIRATMNGLLYQAESVTLARVFFSWLLYRKESRIQSALFDAAIVTIDDESVRKQMIEYRTNIGLSIIGKLVLTSPIAMFLIVIMIVIVFLIGLAVGIFRGLTKLRATITEPIESIETEARGWMIDTSKELIVGGA